MQTTFIETDTALAQKIVSRLGTDAIRCAALRFQLQHYQDVLFTRLGVTCPDGLSRWVPKRKAEYLAGRFAANCCLDQVVDIPTGAHREPIWPPGVIGSITHSNTTAIALTARSCGHLLGIDIESIISDQQIANTQSMFLDEQEQALIQTADARLQKILPTAIFSAKESFFKAVFPVVKQYFDFDAIRCIQFGEHFLTFRMDADFPELLPWLHGKTTFKLPWLYSESPSLEVVTLLHLTI